MAGIPEFRQMTEGIQTDHRELVTHLRQLNEALDALVCYSEVYADLAAAGRVSETGRWLAGWLPRHFQHEENGILASLALRGPEFASFAREMKRQHVAIANSVNSFCGVANRLEAGADIEESVCALKDAGRELSNFLAAHMAAEERKFASS